jgi:flavin-dependent dehydrogenase
MDCRKTGSYLYVNKHLTYDVVIIGGGVAGCATAIALKNLNSTLRIAIIERDVFETTKQRIGETLPPHASQQLQQLGIWDHFLSCGFLSAYGTSSAWGSGELYTNEFMYSPFGYGWNLDRMVFDHLMIDEAQKRGVEFFFNTSCHETMKEPEGWNLICKSEQHTYIITAKFVADATGKKAAFSGLQGVAKISQDQLVGIYRHYEIREDKINGPGKGTYVETDAFGWWYSATIPGNRLIVGYMTDADIANELNLRKPDSWNNLLYKTNYTYKRVAASDTISTPKVVAAQTQHLSSAVGDSWLAVGDAASSYDPVSSLGIYKSLVMSRFAAFAILDDLKGDQTGLKKYQRIIVHDFEEYQTKKQEYYNQEIRFKNHSFWKRRQSNIT